MSKVPVKEGERRKFRPFQEQMSVIFDFCELFFLPHRTSAQTLLRQKLPQKLPHTLPQMRGHENDNRVPIYDVLWELSSDPSTKLIYLPDTVDTEDPVDSCHVISK